MEGCPRRTRRNAKKKVEEKEKWDTGCDKAQSDDFTEEHRIFLRAPIRQAQGKFALFADIDGDAMRC
jgi:hypothetical protein